MTHWAVRYIGLDYVEVHRCWGFVQMLCRDRHGVEMPVLGSEAAIRQAVHGWHQVASSQPDDIAVMMDVDHERHVGFVVEADGTQGLLHAEGSMIKGGAVRFDPWRELRERGYHSFEFWRRNV